MVVEVLRKENEILKRKLTLLAAFANVEAAQGNAYATATLDQVSKVDRDAYFRVGDISPRDSGTEL